MLNRFKERFNKTLEEYEVLTAYNDKQRKFTAGTIRCKLCGDIQNDIDLNSKLRYKSHCKCITNIKCDYCGKLFNPKTRYAKTRKVCYKCNPYTASHGQANEYKDKMRELNWLKLKADFNIDGCQVCGYNRYKGALEFHHVDPNEKDFCPSSIMHHQYDKVKTEIEKCVLLCANCHREVHADIIKINKTIGGGIEYESNFNK